MHVAVLGCGAIGGVIAASLTRAGARVTAITGNAAIGAALAGSGYRVRDLDGTSWSVMPSSPPRVGPGDAAGAASDPFDLVVCATQSTRLEEALDAVRPFLAASAPVVVCQNGLPEERAAKIVGRERVAGCVVGWGASMVEPGLYLRTSKGGFQLGAPAGSEVDLGLVAALLGHAAPAHVAPDFAGVRWSKLAINCCTTTIGAVGGAPLGPLLAHRFIRRLALEVFAEVNAVARALDVRPALVGGTLDIERVAITGEERLARFGSPSLFMKHSVLLAVGFKYRRMRSSMLYALERGRPPEIESLNGEVVRRGASAGVSTPVNRALVEAVRAIAAGRDRSGLDTLRRIHAGTLAGPPVDGDRPRPSA